MTERTEEPDRSLVEQRAEELLPEEIEAGSDDPKAEAEEILAESEDRTDRREEQLADGEAEHRHSEDTVDPT
jgi:hypothetical protein